MKLSSFIATHIENILVEWESFARTLEPAAGQMSSAALRDHARMILLAIAADIDKVETADEQYDKSRGMAPENLGPESAAATHGTLRQTSGFSLIQLTAEYRALRATVLRLWLPNVAQVTPDMTKDMIRFNETIDQALAESVVTYSEKAASTRDTFLAILGHDLRSPLATIVMAGTYLSKAKLEEHRTRDIAAKVLRSAGTMTSMVNDLLEYARTQLGGEMPVAPMPGDVGAICQAALDDARALHPACSYGWTASGDLHAQFDKHRIQQVFSNLLNNAAQYRDETCPVSMTARGEADNVVVTVKNHGTVIPPESLNAIFDPLVQLANDGHPGAAPSRSIGLGLFIAREITVAHGGTLTVASDAVNGTVFTVRLPRVAPL
ncbi:MAG: HAMP domain-containing sensor histidine kinase [Pseudomonadota bacterium]